MKRVGLLIVALALVAGPTGWVVSDRLEARNTFCVSCHLDTGEPLHARKAREFEAVPPPSLAAAHRAAEAEFRCIDCHGGASLLNHARIKLVAARDAAVYVLGRFDEPADMDFPLWDEDCVQCHETYAAERSDDFHAIADHNVPAFEYRCVDCHSAHPTDGESRFAFLHRESVLAVCRNCHEEF